MSIVPVLRYLRSPPWVVSGRGFDWTKELGVGLSMNYQEYSKKFVSSASDLRIINCPLSLGCRSRLPLQPNASC